MVSNFGIAPVNSGRRPLNSTILLAPNARTRRCAGLSAFDSVGQFQLEPLVELTESARQYDVSPLKKTSVEGAGWSIKRVVVSCWIQTALSLTQSGSVQLGSQTSGTICAGMPAVLDQDAVSSTPPSRVPTMRSYSKRPRPLHKIQDADVDPLMRSVEGGRAGQGPRTGVANREACDVARRQLVDARRG